MTDAQNPRLAQAAHDDLRWRILSGELPAGVLMTEAEICEITGLSKAPVRAALAELRHARLIDILPRKGFLIRPWSPREGADLVAARLVIEPEAAALAARYRSARDLETLGTIIERWKVAAGQEDQRALVMIDHDLHVAVALTSGNSVFADIVSALKARSHHQFAIAASAPKLIAQIRVDHDAILAAIVEGNPEAARKAMRDHIGDLPASGTHGRHVAPVM